MFSRATPGFIALLMVSVTFAADFESGRAAAEAGDQARAMQEWRAAAEQGDPRSLFQLGSFYQEGAGVPQDAVTAFALYRMSALQGLPRGEKASTDLANTMSGGDLAKALDLTKKLKAQGKFLPPLPGWPVAPAATAARTTTAPVPRPVPVPAPVPAPRVPTPQDMALAPAPTSATVPAAASASVTASVPAATADPLFDLKYSCQMALRYQDKGSGGKRDLALFLPASGGGYFLLGGYAQSAYDEPYGCTLVLRPLSEAASRFLVRPAGWQRVWKDKGTGSLVDGSIWSAVSPDAQHVCLGQVGQSGYDQPIIDDYRCVHRCLTETRASTNPIWTTGDTGADEKIKVYVLPRLNSFVAAPKDSPPAEVTDLKLELQCR